MYYDWKAFVGTNKFRSLNAKRSDEGLELLVVLLVSQSPDSLPLQPFDRDYLQL